ncbi:SGNH/GDSL hydrolase family protein [Streptomyces sp. LX-29]|uniref:SGNH/GDSL hydrolase family protein n=1 Tax=Streptomyces sp. LX-29 TaxID=2900152 RepID=UPI00240E0D1F|nr:SGNH/GDSL hydrolase family protein [Streptomyces sp. LX-29]WFB09749.1 SGNH/GDSL hydrolase family protein [Streptomyces sp. LX-29]
MSNARGAVAAALSVAALLTGCTAAGQDDQASGSGQGAGSGARPSAPPAPQWDTRPTSIASVGDSITRGFDACSVLSDCPEVSWSTGTEVNSLARRLLPPTTEGSPARSWNYAKTGARMADLPGQLRSAAERRPELVTVLIGANDACRDDVDDMTPVSEFSADFSSSLRELRRTLPKTQVYVASVPDLRRLWSEGRGNFLGKQIWKLGICPSMLKDSDDTDPEAVARRSRVEDRVRAYNSALKDICGRDPLCRYDAAVHDYRFTTDELSKWDWFHPSKEGQEVLADIAYREITRKEPTA